MVAPVYLLLGPEAGDKGQRIKDIRAELRQQIGGEPELHRFYPFETENGELFSALDNNSLFSDHRLVILSQAEDLSAALTAQLVEYIGHPSSTATLLIVSNETSVSSKLMSAVPKAQTEIFWEMFENRKADWVRTFFRKAGMMIGNNAVDLLLDLVENNTQELKNTCSQLIMFLQSDPQRQDGQVTEDDVDSYIYHSRQESVFSLFEHIARGELERSLATLHVLARSGQGEPVPLIAGLVWQFRRLMSIQMQRKEGTSFSEALAGASVLGQKSPIRRKKDQELYAKACDRYSLDDIRRIIALLSDYDIRTREMGSDMQQPLLEHCLYLIIEKKGIRTTIPVGASFSSLRIR
ncbi:MAG: DNA polymerase III subunit delta [Sphaerochaetaceae bacterium]|jgi:DNA polymerase-3 subunit delta